MKTSVTAAALVLLLSGASFGQDNAVPRRRMTAQADVMARRLSQERPARVRLLDLDEDGSAPVAVVFDGPSARRQASRFTRFTRLAGMFMGRVSALSMGPVKVTFDIDIR